jgi:predicted histone-like DNA-binding protein
MTVYYKISPVKSHFDPEGKVRYIARPCKRRKINIDEISEIISTRSSFSKPDVMGVLYSFVDLIPELLMENCMVHLKPLGVFSLSYKSKSVENPEDISLRSVTEVRMQFRPDPEVKRMLMKTEVRKE